MELLVWLQKRQRAIMVCLFLWLSVRGIVVGSVGPHHHGNHRHASISATTQTPLPTLSLWLYPSYQRHMPPTATSIKPPLFLRESLTGQSLSPNVVPSSISSSVFSSSIKINSIETADSRTLSIPMELPVSSPVTVDSMELLAVSSHTHCPTVVQPIIDSITMDTVQATPHSNHTDHPTVSPVQATPHSNHTPSTLSPHSPEPITVSSSQLLSSSTPLPYVTTPTNSGSSGLSLESRLLLYIIPPVGVVLFCIVCVSVLLACRKYRRMYRVRQHLMPLTNIEGSEDSDEDSLEDHSHSFQIHSTSLSNRPVLAFTEDDEEY